MPKSDYFSYLKSRIRLANAFTVLIALCFLCAGTLFLVLRILRPAYGDGFIVLAVLMYVFAGASIVARALYVRFLKRAIATKELENSFVPNKKVNHGAEKHLWD